jgi:hypothetical protein
MPEHGARGSAIGCMVGIGDGETTQPAVIERGLQVRQCAVGGQRRAFGCKQHQASGGVKHAAIQGQLPVGQPEDELLVGGKKEFERGALFDLLREIAGRSETQPDLPPGVPGEALGNLRQCELEIGRCCHDRHISRPCAE